MSRTLRRTVIACRVPAAGVAAVLLLVACGGGDGYSAAAPSAASSSAPDSAEATDAAGTTVPPGRVDFCPQAAGLDQGVGWALTDRKDDDPSVPDASHQIGEELRGIAAPAVITSD